MSKKTALISVSDKTGLLEFAQALAGMDIRILSTGGTLKFLKDKGIPATAISEYTGSPEILDGRVKTLHPKIHGGLLGIRDNEVHKQAMRENAIEPIDIVAVNLYPFRETVAKPDVALEDAIENIDIGGPAMLRSSAKNYRFVTVVCDPADYGTVVQELKREGDTSPATRQTLALKVFRHTADYDSAIDEYLSATLANAPSLRLSFVEGRTLRYGENDHQKASFFLERDARSGKEPNLGSARQLHGKELSYNNLVDADAALESARELQDAPAVSIIKHMNPCGYATGATLAEAFEAAWEGDPVSAFGSVIAVTRPMDLATAEKLKGRFVELLIAPGFSPDALEYLQKKSKDIRLLDIGTMAPATDRKVYKHILGGMLVQDRDVELNRKWESPTQTKIPENLSALALFTWKACKHVKSNAIVIGQEYAPGRYTLVGMGPGQPNRIDSNLKLSQPRARENLRRQAEQKGLEPDAYVKEALSRCVLASDAFFPFDDNVVAAHEGGIRYILQPGGSLRDPDVIATADKLGVAMVFTGRGISAIETDRMIDINPQLQSKIFDSLLLHMKAERKGAQYPRPAVPRGKSQRGKDSGRPAGGKSGPGMSSPQWDSLAADLHRLGLNKTTADALVSWAASQAEQSRQSPVKIRVLHPMEREFISVEAYDYLLELYRLGLIGPPQLENLIENCAFLTTLPANREQIGKMALRAFAESLELQGLGSSH